MSGRERLPSSIMLSEVQLGATLELGEYYTRSMKFDDWPGLYMWFTRGLKDKDGARMA